MRFSFISVKVESSQRNINESVAECRVRQMFSHTSINTRLAFPFSRGSTFHAEISNFHRDGPLRVANDRDYICDQPDDGSRGDLLPFFLDRILTMSFTTLQTRYRGTREKLFLHRNNAATKKVGILNKA